MAQILDYAFTVSGHAYKLEDELLTINKRQKFLTALNQSSKSWLDFLKQTSEAHPDQPAPRPSIIPTIAEIEEPQNQLQARFLWVGLVPDEEILPSEKELGKALSGKGKPVGTTVPKDYYKSTSGRPPLRVVVPLHEKLPEGGVKLYVLLNPDKSTGLCRPYTVHQNYVFYFAEHRDDSVSLNVRRKSWNNTILMSTLKHASVLDVSGRRTLSKTSTATIEPIKCEPKSSFANEIYFLTSAFAMTRDTKILDKMSSLLEKTDPDLENRPRRNSRHIQKFLQLPSPKIENLFGTLEAQKFIEEATRAWPNDPCNNLSVLQVLFLKEGLNESRNSLRYSHLRGFLALAAERLKTNKLDAKAFVDDTCRTVRLVLGENSPTITPRVSIQQDQLGSLLNAVVIKLREISHGSREQCSQLRSLKGERVLPHSWEKLVNDLGSAIDIDTARLIYEQALLFHTGQLAAANNVCAEMIDKVADVLQELLVRETSDSSSSDEDSDEE